MTTHDDYWQTATQVCTTLELQALALRDRHDYGTRLIAMTLGVSRSTIRDRLASADRKIHAALQHPKEPAA